MNMDEIRANHLIIWSYRDSSYERELFVIAPRIQGGPDPLVYTAHENNMEREWYLSICCYSEIVKRIALHKLVPATTFTSHLLDACPSEIRENVITFGRNGSRFTGDFEFEIAPSRMILERELGSRQDWRCTAVPYHEFGVCVVEGVWIPAPRATGELPGQVEVCRDCGLHYGPEQMRSFAYGRDEITRRVCAGCRSGYARCDLCGYRYAENEMEECGVEDTGYNSDGDDCADIVSVCAACAGTPDRNVIHRYNFVPKKFKSYHMPRELPTKFFYGWELEVDKGGLEGKKFTVNRDVKELGLKDIPYLYLKEDGSLVNGWEMVSHPGSIKFWLSQDYEYFQKIAEKAYDFLETCGMHVHVSRSAFCPVDANGQPVGTDTKGRPTGTKYILRLLQFFNLNRKFALIVSGRDRHSMDRWSAIDTVKFDHANIWHQDQRRNIGLGERRRPNPFYGNLIYTKTGAMRGMISKVKCRDCSKKYEVVNTLHEKTIEFRLFASTLNPNQFKLNLMFVSAACNWVKVCPYRGLTATNFVAYVEKHWVKLFGKRHATMAEMLVRWLKTVGHQAIAEDKPLWDRANTIEILSPSAV